MSFFAAMRRWMRNQMMRGMLTTKQATLSRDTDRPLAPLSNGQNLRSCRNGYSAASARSGARSGT